MVKLKSTRFKLTPKNYMTLVPLTTKYSNQNWKYLLSNQYIGKKN